MFPLAVMHTTPEKITPSRYKYANTVYKIKVNFQYLQLRHLIGNSVYYSSFKIYENISRFIPLSDDSIPDFSEELVVCVFIFVR